MCIHNQRKRILSEVDLQSIVPQSIEWNEHSEMLNEIFHKNIFQYTLGTDVMPAIDSKLKAFYLKNLVVDLDDIIEISQKTINQNNSTWKFERLKRICASDAYELYKYSKITDPDWTKKIQNYLNPSNLKSSAIKFGSSKLSSALKAYEEFTKYKIHKMGFVINRNRPWIGCSPDGYIRALKKVVVVDCPRSGDKKPIFEVIKTLSYLNENACLKVDHSCYAQVQLTLAVLNARSCDFLIYSKFSNRFHLITIFPNYDFIQKIVSTLTSVYFLHQLPILHSLTKKS